MLRSFITAVAVLATTAFAQTSSDCNPLNKTCPPDEALGIKNYTWNVPANQDIDFKVWNSTGRLAPTIGSDGLKFRISQKEDSPTLVSKFYYFFGVVSVVMKASPGTGIISAITSLSDDLDEIDWEFKGGVANTAFTNFYGKKYDGMPGVGTDQNTTFDVRGEFHNYTTVWTNETLQWMIDGNVVRTVKYNEPSTQGGLRYPQTPMSVRIGSWAGGSSSSNGTVEWAGGATDYSKGPFDMMVQSVYISDYSTGSQYIYADNSGMSQNIRIVGGNSTVAKYLADQADQTTLSQKIANLSPGVKIGIAIGALCLLAIGILVMTICCIKQRRAGRKERAIADADFQKHEAELMAYRMAQKQQGQMPGFGYEDFKGRR